LQLYANFLILQHKFNTGACQWLLQCILKSRESGPVLHAILKDNMETIRYSGSNSLLLETNVISVVVEYLIEYIQQLW